ncbi:MAG: signal peptidase II, partial [Staphylococcus sp.]|nr:signal peptidase II [Staphylococcus sp.]
MKKKYYITISLIVAIAILIIDQVTKRIIATTMN